MWSNVYDYIFSFEMTQWDIKNASAMTYWGLPLYGNFASFVFRLTQHKQKLCTLYKDIYLSFRRQIVPFQCLQMESITILYITISV